MGMRQSIPIIYFAICLGVGCGSPDVSNTPHGQGETDVGDPVLPDGIGDHNPGNGNVGDLSLTDSHNNGDDDTYVGDQFAGDIATSGDHWGDTVVNGDYEGDIYIAGDYMGDGYNSGDFVIC